MDMSNRYAINAPDTLSEDFNGEIVILNLANGRYFSLRGIASPMWSRLLAGHAPDAILASVNDRRPDLADDASAFLTRLVELDLVRPAGEAAVGHPIDEVWSGEAPTIEIFDDLAELIFADPIHDVDEEAGWPAPRPAQ